MNDRNSDRVTATQHAADMAAYIEAGRARTLALGNRGPLRYAADGSVHPDILTAYWDHGFYVLEDVVDTVELTELRAGVDEMLRRAPIEPGASFDASGQPALGHDLVRDTYLWVAPLTDPMGGTAAGSGRHYDDSQIDRAVHRATQCFVAEARQHLHLDLSEARGELL